MVSAAETLCAAGGRVQSGRHLPRGLSTHPPLTLTSSPDRFQEQRINHAFKNN